MNLKEIFFSKFGLFLEKISPKNEVQKCLKMLRPFEIKKNLIRLGEENDGGYLIPDDLENIQFCFSAGVSNLTKFEKDLQEKYNIKSIMADPILVDTAILPKDSKFINKYIKSFNDDQSLDINKFIDTENEIILKIDIEGGEYEVLFSLDNKKLNQIRILILELHDLRNLRYNFFQNLFKSLMQKLNNNFYICHLHPNNSGKVKKIRDFYVPDMLEITLINKNRINYKPDFSHNFNHHLDKKIDPQKKEIFIDNNWFN